MALPIPSGLCGRPENATVSGLEKVQEWGREVPTPQTVDKAMSTKEGTTQGYLDLGKERLKEAGYRKQT